MRLPEFTAGASLSANTRTPYWTVATATPFGGAIYPAVRLGCMAKCLAAMGDDPFAYENCHCICYGHPGRTCWLQ
jgi:hypothetical protein